MLKSLLSAKPPVCKLIDYGKYRYELARKEKEARKKQKVIDIKEIRFSPNIDTNDLNTKINAARKFIEKGSKVKVSMRFRGRDSSYRRKYACAYRLRQGAFLKILPLSKRRLRWKAEQCQCSLTEKNNRLKGDLYHAKDENKQSSSKAFLKLLEQESLRE